MLGKKWNLLVFFTAAVAMSSVQAADYEIDVAHSEIGFGVRHVGINTVRGRFKNFSGKVSYDPKQIEKTKINVEIVAASLDTGNDKRDEHVKNTDFLDVKKFSNIKFVSKSVKAQSKDKIKVLGDLTLHGVTKEVSLDVSDLAGPGVNPLDKKQHFGASATATIVRQDFGITWNGGGMTGLAGEAAIGNEIKIQIDLDGMDIAEVKK